VQERARLGDDHDLVASARDVEPVERLDRRFRLTFGGAEGGEIVPADERLGGGVHGLVIEAPADPPDAAAVDDRRRATVEQAVEVAAPHRREAGVEIVGDRLRRENGDGFLPQMGIDGAADGIGRPVAREVDVGDLAQRMDARIGAPGALDRGRLAAEGGDRLLDRLLHRAAVLLALPADIGTAVIFDGQLVARHLKRAW
jgi:hypothetical protein